MVDGWLDKSTGIVIQARMSSTRLPGKVLLPFPIGSTETVLSTIYNSLCSTGASVIVATSSCPDSDPIEFYCKSKGINFYRGSENDVYSRFYELQELHSYTHIFRFTADNPLIDLNKMKQFS